MLITSLSDLVSSYGYLPAVTLVFGIGTGGETVPSCHKGNETSGDDKCSGDMFCGLSCILDMGSSAKLWEQRVSLLSKMQCKTLV